MVILVFKVKIYDLLVYCLVTLFTIYEIEPSKKMACSTISSKEIELQDTS